ncbi:peptidyl-prolyl cis-trans isomerase [Peribacillus tepidiphilus]|uniref:peptidyl-prolyl cis-trans isomerase n=1 Tax=Peribacillus tepidiphilus TaxID=2652445 RepID=UPI0035B51058
MENIILLKGKVKFPITLDPGVWIFDDRKKELHEFFSNEKIETDDIESYTKAVSEHWDREIREGAIVPPTLKTEKVFKKQQVLNGTFGISFHHFLKNASPVKEATIIKVITTEGAHTFQLKEAENFILCFSRDGKPLKEDGPVHLYLKDGSNRKHPIKNVKAFEIE